eukprot:CAMPEP_0202691564 /NCGR_PEP_ID=MMETSP1385-20130828/6246_1 /ASSEMBLY_ACC=CAM_ASM_000861 /TAXON_ID=933848 /ORGANISM="Elphidium margaritaceum" /LENGTH=318 /DNA_ID=CAMNT_0049346991 /DNA_START=148 /DNA_END=1104 /DNA_ORIENTATION=+
MSQINPNESVKQIYKKKISKIHSQKVKHRTVSKRKVSPFFKCQIVAATKIDENFQLDPDDNIFYLLSVGFFKEALFLIRNNNNEAKMGQKSGGGGGGYSKPKRLHTFSSGEGNRVVSANAYKHASIKKNKYSILHCRALNKFHRFLYCVKSNDLQSEVWTFDAHFLPIQWMISSPVNNNLCYALVVDWDKHCAILHGLLCYTGQASCEAFEIARFGLRVDVNINNVKQNHHCYCMCYLSKVHKLCVVIEGQCFLVYHEDEKQKTEAIKNGWHVYNVGMLIKEHDPLTYFYPSSIAQYKNTHYVIGVNGTNIASLFQIL